MRAERKKHPIPGSLPESMRADLRCGRASRRSQVILELAQKDPCIIVGRCADAILKSAGIPVISLFICAPFGDRIRRRMEIEGLGPKEAEDTIRKIDKQRKKYYDTYTGRNWGVPENYDFCINSSVMGIEETAEHIITWTRGNW